MKEPDEIRQEVLSCLPRKDQTGLKMIAYAILYLADVLKSKVTCQYKGECGYKLED